MARYQPLLSRPVGRHMLVVMCLVLVIRRFLRLEMMSTKQAIPRPGLETMHSVKA